MLGREAWQLVVVWCSIQQARNGLRQGKVVNGSGETGEGSRVVGRGSVEITRPSRTLRCLWRRALQLSVTCFSREVVRQKTPSSSVS